MKKEIWKDVRGFKGLYQISSHGRVRSLDRIIVTRRKLKGRILRLSGGSTQKGAERYLCCSIGEVHRLVAETFLYKKSKSKLEVNHIDFNKRNNKIENLKWVTRRENRYHNIHYGRHNVVKLTPKQVVEIRKRREKGEKVNSLAREYKVCRQVITDIYMRRTWTYLLGKNISPGV